MAYISFEPGEHMPENGLTPIWWWKEKEMNEFWTPNVPLWEFLMPYEIYMLCIGESIDIDDKVVFENFTRTS